MQRFTSLKRACTMAVIAGAALASSAALAQQQFVNILTGGQSGVYYPWAWHCRRSAQVHSQCAPPPR